MVQIQGDQRARKIGQKPEFGLFSLIGPNLARILALGPKKSNGIGCKLLGTTLLHVLGPKLVRILNF